MKNLEPLGARLLNFYWILSVIVLNTLLLLIVLNVAAQLYLDAKSARAKSKHDARDVFAHRAYDPSLAPLYPGLDEGQISELIKETRKLTQEYDSYTQFKERPVNAKYVKVYPEGFRNGKNQAQWPPDKKAFNIFVFGGSTCFGYRVADDSTIPSHLQELIRRETDLPAAVYNFGRGGYISTQERALFEKLILQGHIPCMAIFIDGLNDLSVPSGEPIHTKDLRKLMDTDETPKWDSCFQALPVAKLILNTSKSEDRDRKEHDGQSTNSEEAYEKRAHTIIERYRTNKKMIDAIAKTFKIVPAFVWQPVPVYGYEQQYNLFGKFNFDGKVPLLRPGYRVMASENQSGSLGDNFIWCADIQRNLRKPLYVDAVHYSGEMCALIARDIFNKLRQRGLLAFK